MKRRFLMFLACIACLSLPVMPGLSAAPIAPVAAPDGQRFLFIVDTSSDMERLKDAIETTLYELIGSGLYGQMQTGDTYGMWMFEKETHAGKFPMQVYDSRRGSQLATIAAAYLSNVNYENSPEMKQMTDLLKTVVHAVSNLNVFIISDGSTSMRGTLFDKAINAEYKKKRHERSSAKRPFVTALIARGGSITNFSVVVGGQPIPLPERPAPTVATTKVAPPPNRPAGILLSNTVTTSATLLQSVKKPLDQSVPAPATTSVVTISQPSSNAVVKAAVPATRIIEIVTRSNSVSDATESSAPGPGPADLTHASNEIQTNNLATELSAPASAPPSLPTAATLPVAESPVPRAALAAILPAPVTVAARELHPEPEAASPAPTPAMQAAALPMPPGPGAGLFLAFGSLLMAAAMFLSFVVFRRLRPTPSGSLITQSMQRR